MGEVDLPVLIGPQVFQLAFQVLDIFPAYSCLLGRPWIHSAGAVTSTLHQKMKFAIQGKLVIVLGEEDFVVSHLSSFKYVDVGDEVVEIPLQSFEMVNNVQEKPKVVEEPKVLEEPKEVGVEEKLKSPLEPKASLFSWKDVKAMIDAGKRTGWGEVIEVVEKQDKHGLGYTPSLLRAKGPEIKKGEVPSIEKVFSAAGIHSEGDVAMTNDDDYKIELSKIVFRTPPGTALNNWTLMEIPPTVSFSK